MVKEIKLENFSDLAKVMEEVRVQSTEKNDYYYNRVYLVGIDTIKKFEETYNVRFADHSWEWADKITQNLKIQGSAKFVYVGEIHIFADNRDWQTEEYKRPRFSMEHIQRVVEYKNHLLTTGCSHGDKTYRFYLFNEDTDDLSQVTVEKPNKVGTLTDKKADAWLNALLDEVAQAAVKFNENLATIKAFKNKLADLTKRPLSDFSDDNGTIWLGMFKVTWRCEPKTGYTHFDLDFNICAKDENGKYLNDEDRLTILCNAGLLK